VFPLKDNIPTDRVPILTILLIVACAVVYFFLQGGGITHGPRDAEVIKYGAIPYEVTHPGDDCGTSATLPGGAALGTNGAVVCEGQQVTLSDGRRATVERTGGGGGVSAWLTLLTSMFMHGSILHLAGNMLFLWIFGGNVEDAMSRWRYALFYLLGGLAAIALQVAIHPDAAVPTVGASGAIAAVLGGYIVLYPRARVVTVVFILFFFTLIELPAFVMLGLWFLEQALVGASSLAQPAGEQGGGVAYFAHVGGFVFGLLAIRLFASRRKRQGPPGIPAWT
jgi:membrane associated rhomboid family serine protease